MSITPDKIDQSVRRFVDDIVPNAELHYVNLVKGVANGACSQNVKEMIHHAGGKIRIGWRIWTEPKKYFDAEAHSIWETPNGQLVDLTDTGYVEDVRTLFFDDPNIKGFPGEDFIPSIRSNICGHPLVDQFIEAKALSDLHNDKQFLSGGTLPDIPVQAHTIKLHNQILNLTI